MKTFLGVKNKALDRETAMALAGINILATPGLGTLIAGKFFAGIVQLIFSVAGFSLIIHWFYTLFKSMISGGASGASSEWQLGLVFFGIGWILSVFSSLSLIRNAPSKKPPRLDGSSG